MISGRITGRCSRRRRGWERKIEFETWRRRRAPEALDRRRENIKIVAIFIAIFLLPIFYATESLGTETVDNRHLLAPAIVATGFNIVGIAGNIGNLVAKKSNRGMAHFGLVSGGISLNFAILMLQYGPDYNREAPYMAVSGVVVFGCGVLNLYLARRGVDRAELDSKVKFTPVLRIKDNDQFAGVAITRSF